MNEHIENILADLDIDLHTDEGVLMTSVLVSPKDLRKFAEEIVRECMTLMNNERDYYAKPGSYESESYYVRCAAKEDAFDDAARLIKNHFGIND